LSEAERAVVLHHGKVITTDDPRSAQGKHRLLDAYKNGADLAHVTLQVSR
jgi:branched-chain amino acid transport system ATP-binding protein